MIRGIRPLLGGACLLLGAACGMIPKAPPGPLPELAGEPDQLIARIAAEEKRLVSLRGLANVLYRGSAGSGSVLQAIVIALPDRARLETLSPVGTTVLLLTIHGDDLRMHSLLRHEYGVGRATKETLARLVKLPLPPGPLLRVLAGLPPLALRPDDPRVQVSVESPAIRVDSVDGVYWQRLWMGPDGSGVEHGELGEAAGPLLRFQFGDRQPVDGASFPFEIRLEGSAAETALIIRYQTVRLNLPVEAELFELPRPTDGQTRMLDLGGGFLP
jgi:hypothetical protein